MKNERTNSNRSSGGLVNLAGIDTDSGDGGVSSGSPSGGNGTSESGSLGTGDASGSDGIDGGSRDIDSGGSGGNGVGNTLGTVGDTVGDASGVRGSDGTDSGTGKRRRGRPRGSGNSGQLAGSGTGNGTDTAEGKGSSVKDNVRSINGPKKEGFSFDGVLSSGSKKHKKGYAPLLDKTNSIEIVDNGFAILGLVIGEHWNLDPKESKELGERLFRVLDCFPVKIENNPEMLEKVMALIGLAVAAVTIGGGRIQQTLELREKQSNGIFRKPETATVNNRGDATGTPEGIRDTVAAAGPSVYDEGGDDGRISRFEASIRAA